MLFNWPARRSKKYLVYMTWHESITFEVKITGFHLLELLIILTSKNQEKIRISLILMPKSLLKTFPRFFISYNFCSIFANFFNSLISSFCSQPKVFPTLITIPLSFSPCGDSLAEQPSFPFFQTVRDQQSLTSPCLFGSAVGMSFLELF